MPKTILVTVSDDRQGRKGGVYGKTQQSIDQLLGVANVKLQHEQYTQEECFRYLFKRTSHPMADMLDAGMNGRWYKPFAILDALASDKVYDGDFIIYNDCSPELWGVNSIVFDPDDFNLQVIHDLTESNSDILTAFVKWDYQNIPAKGLGMHIHKYFTTDLCMNTMGMRQYENSYQHASGMMCIRKTPETVKFVEEWLYWNLNPKCASLGDPESGTDGYWQSESDRKIGHRHDQSISGLLLNQRNADLVDILHNDMNPYNFLQFCRVGQDYKFINSNTPVEPRMDMNKVFIRVGSHVRNEANVLLRVYGVNGNDIKVGQFEESCWIEDRSKLKLS